MSSNNFRDVVLYPNKINASNWNTSLELWNKGNNVTTVNNNTVYKTIYSPSPTGFVEPKTAAYTGFTTTGAWTNNRALFNVSGTFVKGWNFFCLPNLSGSTIFFPALGCFSSNNSLLDKFSTLGFYWTAGRTTTINAQDLDFSSGSVSPQGEYTSTFGLTMLSAFE